MDIFQKKKLDQNARDIQRTLNPSLFPSTRSNIFQNKTKSAAQSVSSIWKKSFSSIEYPAAERLGATSYLFRATIDFEKSAKKNDICHFLFSI